VLKINNYTLEDGEQSVFDSELAGRQDRVGEKDHSRMRAGHDYDNQPLCQVCWGGGELLCCDFCPGAYHPACIGITDVDSLPNMWSCDHHRCCLCSRKAQAAGGLLFRCEACPKAWCEDHLPLEAELLGGEVERLAALGFGAVKQACYCYCGVECRELREMRDEEDAIEFGGGVCAEEGEEAEESEEGEEGEEGDEDADVAGLRAAVEQMEAPLNLNVGDSVEVSSTREGEEDSWYPARLVSMRSGMANVEHAVLEDDEGEYLVERLPLSQLRPLPPEPPDGWEACVKPGALLELSHLDGWWDVEVLKPAKASGKWQVLAHKYDARHTVGVERLRPGWVWQPGHGAWAIR